ncbi:(2Fe-2S)-binding protein [Hydrogenophaga sp. BPS33]|uniref:(2Fe-2S)-binding protein n=1 Tax=Hydrogenophaga sp. BPS33 TaxID=2651974 RepID=UPI00131F8919|nr:(2Fe-2S)-binding protein [Hydrogenophaga sp. BPS33]QHE87802.1 (2Fe-2S)-binding protein [Hydrogenophaga sp. BPS33]
MALFHTADCAVEHVEVRVAGRSVSVPPACSAAAAVLLAGETTTRIAPGDLTPRAPYCMMGVCFECLMTIDGVPDRQACLIRVVPGMVIDIATHVEELR